MPRYEVLLPIAGFVGVAVDAPSEEKAIAVALDHPEMTTADIIEWEVYEKLCEGNVLHASRYNEPEAWLSQDQDE